MKTTRLALFTAAATLAATLVAAPAFAKAGKFDPFLDGARAETSVYSNGGKIGQFDVFTDGAKVGKFDPYTDGAKVGKFDPYTDGAAR
ncbi:hypothetical protein CURE108131_08235 [Cupriavidus respiraculi]|uniref:Uncharacterized protein n=1 Tax=Cupriavidus respiraculi TaxID=195930 RepID=A0ABN7Z8S3_9BURK|nr:hypothetical protein [Cupriavidus respiraculi]CAG9182372.1 hypothetical protein LMG21510_04553 [Cupriavidus respiraculi]